MPAKAIERISMPEEGVFLREYVETRTPVIITDLFAGQPIREITTFEQALATFGNIPLHVQTEYAVAAARPSEAVEATMTFRDYWDHVQKHPQSALLCTEYEIPARIMSLFTLPEICRRGVADQREILDMPRKYGDCDLCANLFVANRGNKAHLHFDGDHRQVFLHQVFGRKLVLLFQPEASTRLKTLEGTPWSSGVYLEDMSDEQKLALVDELGGLQATLYPGDTIYIPMLMWHYLEYMDDAMSFNLRFGRTQFGRFLSVDNFHRDSYIQNFGSRLTSRTEGNPAYMNAVQALIEKYIQPAESLRAKVSSMRRVLKEVCLELLPETRPDLYCPEHMEQHELDKIMADIGQTARFVDPATVAKSRPVGPINATQRQQIERGAQRLGYSTETLCHLVSNRLGKSAVDELTKTEAVQFMAYMRSAGAAL